MQKTILWLILMILFFSILQVSFAVTIPEMIRVGLFYNDAKKQLTSKESVALSSDSPLQIQILQNNQLLFKKEIQASKVIGILKEKYQSMFNETHLHNGISIEIDTLEEQSKKAYYLMVGDVFATLEEAEIVLQSYKDRGLNVFCMYRNQSYEIWMGQYETLEEVKKAQEVLQQKLDSSVKTLIVLPKDHRTMLTIDTTIAMMTEGLDLVFRIQPVSMGAKASNVIRLGKENAKWYRGTIELLRLPGNDMKVINELTMDEYLYGVVPLEVGGYAHMEAMKAQAVTARTYAMNSLGKHKSLGFDICPTQHCQVYGGVLAETEKSNRAVDETHDLIVRYDAKPAQVFYFSSSGGQTEDVQNVWGSKFPYLVSREDKYETGKTTNYHWNLERTSQQIQGYLAKRGVDIGEVTDIEIANRAPSGRVTSLRFHGTKDKKEYRLESTRTILNVYSQQYSIATDADVSVFNGSTTKQVRIGKYKFMTAQGLKSIASQGHAIKKLDGAGNVSSIAVLPSKYIFSGKGWGHAIGMSQDGAHGMGLAGFTYKDILQHYFPGTSVE